jgi:hypothetical protein
MISKPRIPRKIAIAARMIKDERPPKKTTVLKT